MECCYAKKSVRYYSPKTYRQWWFGANDGHKIGESVLDPVFAIAAIMDWAGIVHNNRGYIEYTPAYRDA